MADTLTLRVDDGRITAEHSNGAVVTGATGGTKLDTAILETFDRWLKRRKLDDRDDFAAFGNLLRRILLDNDVGTMLLREIQHAPEPVRVELDFTRAPDLATLPWEFLYQPGPEDFFYATDQRVSLTRGLGLPSPAGDLRARESPLRVLVVVSRPTELGFVAADLVVDAIHRLGDEHDVAVLVDDTALAGGLPGLLRDVRPHVVHYVGHGCFDAASGRSKLAFTQPGGVRAHWVDEVAVSRMFEDITPRLVVLQACEGGVVDASTTFSGVAPLLLRRGIPAVVAMQYPVSNPAATVFCVRFYDALAARSPVEVAVQDGRHAVACAQPSVHSQRDFGAPVIYLRGRDGRILPDRDLPRRVESRHG